VTTTAITAFPPAGPRGLPLVGSLLRFVWDPLAFFTGLRRDYGDVAGFSLGGAFGGHPCSSAIPTT